MTNEVIESLIYQYMNHIISEDELREQLVYQTMDDDDLFVGVLRQCGIFNNGGIEDENYW